MSIDSQDRLLILTQNDETSTSLWHVLFPVFLHKSHHWENFCS